jgi:septal ring factor EnvC (AmiA/AmiB activator)
MKKLLIIFLCCSAVFCFGQVDLGKKEQALLKQQKKVAKEMFKLRVKLLKNDPALKKLHAKILELHKELALKLDGNKKMRELATRLRKLKNSIASVKEAIEDEDE